MFEIGDEGEDLAEPAIVMLVEAVGVERGQIRLDRAVEPVEHIVEPFGGGELLAVAAVERIERAAQHRLGDIGHAQRLACRAGQCQGRGLARRLVEIDRPRWVARRRARRQQPRQSPRKRPEQRQEQHRRRKVEQRVEIGGRACWVGLKPDDHRPDPVEQ